MSMVEQMARAMEPSAFATFDQGYTQRNAFDLRRYLNAERKVKSARRKARAALAAMRTLPPECYRRAVETTGFNVGAVHSVFVEVIDQALTEGEDNHVDG